MNKNSIAAAALAFGAIAATPAFAEEATLTACTQDGKTSTLKVDASGFLGGGEGAAPVQVKDLAAAAFTKTAKGLDAGELQSDDGVLALIMELNQSAGARQPSPDAGLELLSPITLVPDAPACKP